MLRVAAQGKGEERRMIRIAIVDDEEQFLTEVKNYIQRYAEESGEVFSITEFHTGMDFIGDYSPVYDIVFLDIEMPLMDGMTVARKLRRLDDKIAIVFITKMHQYAIEGYEVDAVDFVVKPIKPFNFTDKLKKAIAYFRARREEEIFLKTEDGILRISIPQIYFVVKDKNYLVYHTDAGELRERGTIESAEQRLKGYGFSRCNSGCLVNLRNIQQLTSTEIVINGTKLPISRSRAKEIKTDMYNLMRGG